MIKVDPASGYPPEEGRYLRGNDYSPVAVAVILIYDQEKIPPDIENLVRVGVESGAALSGTIQTENIGIEKVICNIVANPNIRFIVICGPESPGHSTGEALRALAENGVDQNKRIIGTEAPTPYLFNLPPAFIKRFTEQAKVIDLLNKGDPSLLQEAIHACYQEKPTLFRGVSIGDPGAFPEPPLSGKLTWRITQPQKEPKTPKEREQRNKLRGIMARIKEEVEAKRTK